MESGGFDNSHVIAVSGLMKRKKVYFCKDPFNDVVDQQYESVSGKNKHF